MSGKEKRLSEPIHPEVCDPLLDLAGEKPLDQRLGKRLRLQRVDCFAVDIERQAGIGDRQFLRAMIPHHAAALLMCEKAPVAVSAKSVAMVRARQATRKSAGTAG